jgi:hypothetical protein
MKFWIAGRRIQESSKIPSKTIARTAEQNRRRELEEGFNNFTDIRRERVRTFSDVADVFFNGRSGSDFRTAYLKLQTQFSGDEDYVFGSPVMLGKKPF